MMFAADDGWFIARYHDVVAEAGNEGIDIDKARDRVAQIYADSIENGSIDRLVDGLVEEGRKRFNEWVGPHRTKQRANFRKELEYLIDVLNDNTSMGPNEPVLHAAFPLGDGRDKILGLWSPEDWIRAVNERNSNAVKSAAAAHEFQVMAGKVVERMRADDVNTTSELFYPF